MIIFNEYILTDREVDGIKMILSVSRDNEVKKLLIDRLYKHDHAVMCKNTYRKAKIERIKCLKEYRNQGVNNEKNQSKSD